MFKQHGPAPIPADGLAAALAPFGQSRMLPREAYVDPAVFEWEQHHIFSGWTCVGARQRPHCHGRAEGGRQRAPTEILRCAATIAPSGHLLIPAGTADTNCWRATQPPRVDPSCAHTTRGRIGWTARCATRRVPATSTDSTRVEFGLAELRLVNWHGWLFVDPSGADVDFSHARRGLEDVVGRYRPEDLTIVARHSYELATNWKVIVENYQECYHCSTIHPELSRISPPDQRREHRARRAWMGGWMSIIDDAETMSLTGKSGGVAIQGLSEHELRTVMYLVGYPNLLVSLHPDYVMTHLMTPLAATARTSSVPGPSRRTSRRERLRSLLRRRLLGPDQPAGLGGLRIGSTRARAHRMRDPARWRPTRTASTSSSPGSPGRTRVPLVPRRHPVDTIDRLGVAPTAKATVGAMIPKRVTVDVVDRVAGGGIVRDRTAAPPATPKSRLHFGFAL